MPTACDRHRSKNIPTKNNTRFGAKASTSIKISLPVPLVFGRTVRLVKTCVPARGYVIDCPDVGCYFLTCCGPLLCIFFGVVIAWVGDFRKRKCYQVAPDF
ncbi:hypothetical protein TNIN_129131 [Trichonephila inaurata madagascariensis]|uniref:Uncharacterized protein n=1 Tax=Trichonephila inaurata madagascariensis TaxID=2747483 RepID=A0A8X7CLZ6_9ARAC|nr:hypothetical protein TNIN_129131 [Trichonephila inaurata madagascariensis]